MKLLGNQVKKKAKEAKRKQYKFIDQGIKTDTEVASKYIEKEEAWKKYKENKNNKQEIERRWKYFKWRRNRAKKALKKTVEERNKKVMLEIESLKISNPKAYWKKLKEFSKSKRSNKTGETALNEYAEEVAGDIVKLIWKTKNKRQVKNLQTANGFLVIQSLKQKRRVQIYSSCYKKCLPMMKTPMTAKSQIPRSLKKIKRYMYY